MWPKDREELEVWTRAVVAASVDFSVDSAAVRADAVLNEWRLRRDAIETANREAKEQAESAETARNTKIRKALNAARWKPSTNGPGWYICMIHHGPISRPCDEVSMERHDCQSVQAFGKYGWTTFRRGEPWPSDMGKPPPGWNGGMQ